MEESYLKIGDAAKYLDLTYQSIHLQIRKGKHPNSRFINGKRYIAQTDLDDYKKTRYLRNKSKDDRGNLIYDKSKGIYSVREAADYLQVKIGCIYHLIRQKKLIFKRHGSSYLLAVGNLRQYKEKKLGTYERP